MTHLEIRQKFLRFFEERGHKHVASSSLLPTDPSVLFTTAGMQQFKSYFTGAADPIKDLHSKRATSIQKCMRTSDIDEVGDYSHLTFFEMLGHFSFGDYFKKETIQWTHEFLTQELGIDRNRISATVFAGDDKIPLDKESYDNWAALLPAEKIRKGLREDNVWGPAGPEGPCGAANEVYVDDLEVATLVFMEYQCAKDGTLIPLPQNGVDVGWGFERVVMLMQNKTNIFETDLFLPIIGEVRGKKLYDFEQNLSSERIIADHLRASVFLIADGVRPSNAEQGYVLRRLLRRAIRHAKLLNQPEDLYERVLHVMAHDVYSEVYPELRQKEREILDVILFERDKFSKSLDRGLREFGGTIEGLISQGEKVISGKNAFDLYATYGFPIELIEELAKEKGLSVDVLGFQNEIDSHKARSREGAEKKFGGHGLILDTGELKAGNAEELKTVTRLHTATHLLHAALRAVLGSEVRQAGSDITADRLRFDFTFPRKVTLEELGRVEDTVNDAIKQDLPVTMKEMSYEEAIKLGALAFFKQKYPERVKVYSVGDPKNPYSRELCGGPHVGHTGEIGRFKIIKEEAISAGTRRVRAVVD